MQVSPFTTKSVTIVDLPRADSFDSQSTKKDQNSELQLAGTETAVLEEESERNSGFGIPDALWCFTRQNPLRRVCIIVVSNPWFERALRPSVPIASRWPCECTLDACACADVPPTQV